MLQADQEVDRLYKSQFGKLIAILLSSSREMTPESAEDIIHETFVAALTNWRIYGVPQNGAGWLYRVCKNKAINKLKREASLKTISERFRETPVEIKFSESIIEDYQLKLLFACAHPDLAPKAQVVITLKYVVNLRVEAIAKTLAMTIDGVDKLLLRARQKIRDEKILLAEPHPSALEQRLPIVHKIIYLIFNEGYKSSQGSDVIQEALCEEALILNRLLLSSPWRNKETAALQALMLFNSSRFKSRFGVSGELIDLENQDRGLWNKELFALASIHLNESQSDAPSSYHIEASIAFLHCTAPDFVSTDWPLITRLYERLLHGNNNCFIELNYAIALFYAGQKQQSMNILNRLQQHPFLQHYYPLNMTMGKFLQLEGNGELAGIYLRKALDHTRFIKEKEFIQKMLDLSKS